MGVTAVAVVEGVSVAAAVSEWPHRGNRHRGKWIATSQGRGKVCPGCGVFKLEGDFYVYRGYARKPRAGHPAGERRTHDRHGNQYRVSRCKECVGDAKRAWVAAQGGQAALRERNRRQQSSPEVREAKAAYGREYNKYGSRREREELGVTADEMERDRLAAGLTGGDTGPYHAGGGGRARYRGSELDSGADGLSSPRFAGDGGASSGEAAA